MARTAKKYLSVKYTERELAKRLGAKWDPSVQRWYCPAGSRPRHNLQMARRGRNAE